jgi:two-component system CheB/CheR fusion protein
MATAIKDNEKIENEEIIPSKNLFWVVGVGASAGGLDAFKQLIKAIPKNSGMAFILVQHLDPNHESILVDLLKKDSLIPIQEVTDNVHVEPDNIYVIPSNKILTANDGVLRLNDRVSKIHKSMSIDIFFTSLAEVHQSQAIGVVLSGTGTDGTVGLKTIKQLGGITFAQHKNSAAFDEMPSSAINADVVDFVLSPEEIISHLQTLNKTFKNISKNGKTVASGPEDIFFKQILAMLDMQKGVDFTYYKHTTIRRRISRRMLLKNLEKIEDYFNHLKTSTSELDVLYQDILIPVTEFFRDPKIFASLCETAFPALTKNKTSDFLRIWVVGCSTGQEAYSIGMCLYEFLADQKDSVKIQIFATDVSEIAIEKARSGVYTSHEVEGISMARLQKFFYKVDGGFQISKTIRDMCVFAIHNVLTNPPFANIDLISCRNVLIYMDTFLQRKAMATFHYALREKGMLLLGKSESIGNASELFGTFSEADKLYSRKSVPGRFIQVAAKLREAILTKGTPKAKQPNDDFQRNADDVLLAKADNGVIVNDQMEIVQFRGTTGDWLESAPGKPSLNVMKMAKHGLVLDLRNAIHKAKSTRKPFIKEGIKLKSKGWKRIVTIEVIPLLNTINLYYLILFKNKEESQEEEPEEITAGDDIKMGPQEMRIQQLEKELAQTREDMRLLTEDQEASNEELLSSNEEQLSNSEELRSLNEELEISKEELQSTVEELSASNQELGHRNDEINHARKYSEAIITTIRESLIVLDKDMRIKSANSSYYKTFLKTERETEGKLFYELENNQWDIPDLRKLLERTLHEQSFYESYKVKLRFQSIGERTMLLNARRILKEDKNEQLILLAIEDITERSILEGKLKMFSEELENKVQERTQLLKESNSDLEHSNKNLEQFAFIASHDLQEPLRKIKTFSNMLSNSLGDKLSNDGAVLIDKICAASDRMSVLINDVLKFSRIENVKNKFVEINANDILKNVLNEFNVLITQKNAVVNTNALPVIEAVPLQLYQLFYNIINNSLKFARVDVRPIITISSRNLDEGEIRKYPNLSTQLSYCEILFEDNGIGFNNQYKEKIFLIFTRLHTRDKFPGTGIGLGLCKKIALNHQGDIVAEGRENEGSSFHVILPITQVKK